MATATRSRKQVNGKEIYLAIQKPGDTDYTVVGCAEDIQFKSENGEDTYSCRSGTGKLPDGDDPDWGLELKGFYFIYTSGEKDDNVSFEDFSTWHLGKNVLPAKWGTSFAGDPLFSGPVHIKSLGLGAPNKGLATYDISLSGSAVWSMSAVPNS